MWLCWVFLIFLVTDNLQWWMVAIDDVGNFLLVAPAKIGVGGKGIVIVAGGESADTCIDKSAREKRFIIDGQLDRG